MRLIVTAFAALVQTLAMAQQQPVSFQTQKLSETVHVLMGGGGNIGISAGPDGIFIIDDNVAPLAPRVVEEIAKIQQGPVRFVVNTHWHFDHTGGNELLGEAGAVIVAHENVRKRMSVKQFLKTPNETMEQPASPAAALPVVTFTRDVTFHLNGEDMAATHVAHAHTDGDIVVYFKKSNVVHTGDTYVNTLFPFIDKSSGGSLIGLIAATEKLVADINDETKVIPGHGPVSNKREVRAYHAMLIAARDRIGKLVKEGRTVDQVVAAKPLAEYDKWGKGFISADNFVRTVYEELKGG